MIEDMGMGTMKTIYMHKRRSRSGSDVATI